MDESQKPQNVNGFLDWHRAYLGRGYHRDGACNKATSREDASLNGEIQREVTTCPDLERENFTIHDI